MLDVKSGLSNESDWSKKINKLGRTLSKSWRRVEIFKLDKLNKSKLTESVFFTFSYHIFSTSYYLDILKNPYRSHPAFLVFLRLLSAFSKISTLPPDFAKCDQVCLLFLPIRFLPQTGFHISSIVPPNISAICQKFCTVFSLYFLFFRIFLCDYCSLVVKVCFVLFFFGSFVLVLR